MAPKHLSRFAILHGHDVIQLHAQRFSAAEIAYMLVLPRELVRGFISDYANDLADPAFAETLLRATQSNFRA